MIHSRSHRDVEGQRWWGSPDAVEAQHISERAPGAVPFNGNRPVVCRLENLDACGARAGTPSAETGEKIYCFYHLKAY